MIDAIERLLQFVNAETVVAPGHRPIANRDAPLNFRNVLSTVEDRIQRLITARAPVSEILAAAPTADFDPIWGRGFVTGDIFVRMVLAGLGLAGNGTTTGAA